MEEIEKTEIWTERDEFRFLIKMVKKLSHEKLNALFVCYFDRTFDEVNLKKERILRAFKVLAKKHRNIDLAVWRSYGKYS